MGFTFETAYTQKAMTAMARALRKTVRRKRSRRSTVLGIIVVILGLIFALSATEVNFQLIITLAAVAAVSIVLIWQDPINGYFALKRGLPGLNRSLVTFQEEGYHAMTAVGESDFPYTNIKLIAEDKDYFFFIFSASHAQVYDKHTLSGGTADDFSCFITNKTGRKVEKI